MLILTQIRALFAYIYYKDPTKIKTDDIHRSWQALQMPHSW
jgi:hypothetical protein